MAIDMVGATLAASKLTSSPGAAAKMKGLGVCLPMVSFKAMWINQITGTYHLIFGQGLHVDFPTRLEVQKCVQLAIATHNHTGNLGFPTSPGAGQVLEPLYVKDETMYSKMTRTPPMASQAVSGAVTDEDPPEKPGSPTQVFVRAKSSVKSFGYGV